MKNEVDNVDSTYNEHFEHLISVGEAMNRFLVRSSDYEKIALYRYALERAKQLESIGTEEAIEAIKPYWFTTLELDQTDAIRKYTSGEITEEMIEQHNREQEALVKAILEKFEQRRKEKKSFKYQLKKFLGIKQSRKR